MLDYLATYEGTYDLCLIVERDYCSVVIFIPSALQL